VRPDAQTPASEWRGASPCPPHPEPGHFLYDRWADAGLAPALRTIVQRPAPGQLRRTRPGNAPSSGASTLPSGSPPGLGMLLPRLPLQRLQTLLRPLKQAKGIAILKRVSSAGR
jgi:hypothetical protein